MGSKNSPTDASEARTVSNDSLSSRPDYSSAVQELNILKLFDPNSPWVIVNEGSLMGFFDFVPKHLRVGPWTAVAPIYITILVAKLVYWMPQRESFYLDDEELSAHPLAYSLFWVYNIVVFFWMKFILLQTVQKRGLGVLVTYTIQSWIMLTTRHGLSSLAPFLPRQNILVWFNELLRFPALATASITFLYWNFLIAPFIYFRLPHEQKREFLKFNFNFRMTQVHVFNIIFAILNTIITSSRKFQFVDLWCALAGAIGYALWYLLVLDRIGVHLYPVFSPRTFWSVFSWSTLLGTYFLVYCFWNHVITTW